jgi:hypothetical protein
MNTRYIHCPACGVQLEVAINAANRRPRKVVADWTAVDWTRRNMDLAAQLGVHPIYVSRMRRQFAPATLSDARRKRKPAV